MHFTKVQISELMRKLAEKENGLHDLMEIMLESMMVAERGEFLQNNPGKVVFQSVCLRESASDTLTETLPFTQIQ